MSKRLLTNWLVLTAMAVLLPLGTIGCNKSSSEAAEQDETSQAVSPDSDENSAESAPDDESDDSSGAPQEETSEPSQGAAEAPSPDQYPGVDISQLSGEERQKFLSIAESELCPCEGVTESLNKCLQSQDTCRLARRSGKLITTGISKGFSETDILDRVASFTEEAKKEYDFTLENVPHKGPADAPVKIVEFADFQCPHCKTASEMMKTVREKYGEDVAVYFKHFPLSSHGQSVTAARAAEAARRQGRFWPMHDLLFKNQKSLSKDKIFRFARQIGLNFSKFKEDFNSQDVAQTVQRDKQEAMNANIQGTPAFFINSRRYFGSDTLNGLSEAIEAELEEQQGN